MIKVAIVGSRKYPNRPQVEYFVSYLDPSKHMIISGACPDSPDKWAAETAYEYGIAIKEYPANWKDGKGAGFARNTLIAQDSNVVVNFWDGSSKGAMDTYTKAVQRFSKLGWIVMPDDKEDLLQAILASINTLPGS